VRVFECYEGVCKSGLSLRGLVKLSLFLNMSTFMFS
jgi:hypothetical protein